MPNANRVQTVYVTTGNPATVNDAPSNIYNILPNEGQLGQAFDTNDQAWQYVEVDSGATAATPAGAPEATQLAYWKDRATYKVTNDARFALFNGVASSFRNNVAGVFMGSPTGGYRTFILQRGRAISVKEAGSATAGMSLVANTSTSDCATLGTAINTAPPCQLLGWAIGSTAGGVVSADIDIPNIP